MVALNGKLSCSKTDYVGSYICMVALNGKLSCSKTDYVGSYICMLALNGKVSIPTSMKFCPIFVTIPELRSPHRRGYNTVSLSLP